MIRPFRAETERYGHYSVAGESVWEHPFLGSSVLAPIWPVWAAVTLMSGTVCTYLTLALSCQSPTCRLPMAKRERA